MNIVLQVGGLAQEQAAGRQEMLLGYGKRLGLRRGCQLQIVGAVGNQFVAESVFDLIALQQERAGHALDVAGGKTDKIAIEPGHQHAIDAFAVQVLAQFGAAQPKRFVQLAVGIGKARQVIQLIRSEKLRSALFCAQVHKRDLRALVFDLRAESRELGDRLAAKGSAKVAKEHQQQRALLRERMNGLAGLGTISFQQLRINSFCLKHRCLHLYRFFGERQMLAPSQDYASVQKTGAGLRCKRDTFLGISRTGATSLTARIRSADYRTSARRRTAILRDSNCR